MKKVLITQSNYIPWKGYFDAIQLVDEVILYDDMQYTKRDWRNRNLIKTPQGVQWLTIPVEVKGKFFQAIKDVKISDHNWNTKHWKTLQTVYAKAPCFKEHKDFFENLYHNCHETYLSQINWYFLTHINHFLGIKTPMRFSSDFVLIEGKTERLVNLCQQLQATDYYSGSAAKSYLDEALFEQAGIRLHYLDYSGYPEYPQLYPPFTHQVSILDLIFNTGKQATKYMKYF
ncbi:MAG: WbqC family protein [Microscillaceae bacterium]|nr:WbqC family protein [Microscillaceae bacterium]MDW8459719.1 WbqC family protein [Cytophagales bacterium]